MLFDHLSHLDLAMNRKSQADMVFILNIILGPIRNCLNIHNLWGFKFFFNKINQDGYWGFNQETVYLFWFEYGWVYLWYTCCVYELNNFCVNLKVITK